MIIHQNRKNALKEDKRFYAGNELDMSFQH